MTVIAKFKTGHQRFWDKVERGEKEMCDASGKAQPRDGHAGSLVGNNGSLIGIG